MHLKRTYVQVLCRLMPKTIKAANFYVPVLVQTRAAISWARGFILSKYSSIVQSWAAILVRLGLSIFAYCLLLTVHSIKPHVARQRFVQTWAAD